MQLKCNTWQFYWLNISVFVNLKCNWLPWKAPSWYRNCGVRTTVWQRNLYNQLCCAGCKASGILCYTCVLSSIFREHFPDNECGHLIFIIIYLKEQIWFYVVQQIFSFWWDIFLVKSHLFTFTGIQSPPVHHHNNPRNFC